MTYPSQLGQLPAGQGWHGGEFLARWFRSFTAQLELPMAFVVGCARSGTSILGELLAAHPQVDYLFEVNKIWCCAGEPSDGSHRLSADAATRRVCRMLRRAFRRQSRPGAGLIVEKSPRNALRIPFLRAAFPHAKIIHIIRDGRDTACSLVPGMASGKWMHLRPPDWRQIEAKYHGVLRCAVAWESIIQIALADLEQTNHLEVRYERLVTDPLNVADELLAFLELPCAPSVREFAQRIQDRTAGSYQARFQTQWYRPDHQVRIGRWRENLTPAQQAAIHSLIGPTLTRLGYDVPRCVDNAQSYGITSF